MKKLCSCGVLCLRKAPSIQFLAMRHRDRVDLPKGHMEPGESEMDCALREFREETGIDPAALTLVDSFRYETTCYPRYKRFGGETVEKR